MNKYCVALLPPANGVAKVIISVVFVQVIFSVVSVRQSVHGGADVTITHVALDLTV